MSDIAIKFENISKQYRLGKIGTGTLSHDLKRWWTVSVRRQEDPYLKIGAVNDRSLKADSEYVWALRDINLEVQQGEVLGIIGKNGAGKSTLLKLLSRVTTPTAGRILSKGRIASLLEVGTGFHPEMTGRENIYMNGSIMGMNKAEITRKLDEIVDFAGVAKYIDTPVKRYSSGMTVRLGFAIAAHLEPEILVVDEVLAVGDAEFQKKAVGKMQDVSSNLGRTVLFVSHNMGSIRSLCSSGLLLSNGLIEQAGDVNEIIDRYMSKNFSLSILSYEDLVKFHNTDLLKVVSIYLSNNDNEVVTSYMMGETIFVNIVVEPLISEIELGINIRMSNSQNINISAWRTSETLGNKIYLKTRTKIVLKIPKMPVFAGTYYFSIACTNFNETLFYIDSLLKVEIIASVVEEYLKLPESKLNLIYTSCEWEINRINET